jgi:hypothetical protein
MARGIGDRWYYWEAGGVSHYLDNPISGHAITCKTLQTITKRMSHGLWSAPVLQL